MGCNIVENIKFYKEEVNKINKKAQIVIVSKTIDADRVNLALAQGVSIIGENRVQELLDKYSYYNDSEIHFIGHLQTNKVKYIIDKVSLIQSVDSIKLASVIDKEARKINKIQDILIQINISKEETKSGVYEEEIDEIINKIKQFRNLKIRGFMTIPQKNDEEILRKDFAKMNEIFKRFDDFDILSMGMTNDFKLALENGSTMVRIGSGIFKNSP